jgi:hypothetical protein
MEAAEILSTARSGSAPSSWVILPLRRAQVGVAIAQWAFGTVLGLALFAGLFSATVPDNFESGIGGTIITSFFLALLGFVGLGSLWLLIKDGIRFLRADRSIIVITPDVYCKQEGDKIDLVPLEDIGYLTTRGTRPPSRRSSWAAYNAQPQPAYDPEDRDIANNRATIGSLFYGRRRRPRGPTSVSFVDMRTDQKIAVTSDNSYAHPYELGETLQRYVDARLRKIDEEATAKKRDEGASGR